VCLLVGQNAGCRPKSAEPQDGITALSDVTNDEATTQQPKRSETDCRRQPEGRLKGVNHTMSKELLYLR